MPQRAHYSAPIGAFIGESEDAILGKLTKNSAHDVELPQRNAWIEEITILKNQLAAHPEGHLFLEFSIPRMGKRADAIAIIGPIIFVIEFKVGANTYHHADRAQAVDYALDLKNFHEGSHHALLAPILVATDAPTTVSCFQLAENKVAHCLNCNRSNLSTAIERALALYSSAQPIDATAWINTGYKPTPTIIEAAQALYRDHDVTEISRSDASAKNLRETSHAISEIIASAKANGEKAICFVTGVPGAGKTLAGLSITTSQMNHEEDEHAVFLSGNGPLVQVLRTALAKDEKARSGGTLIDARRKANAFIQNIHHFRDASLETNDPPPDRVIVFDEAQRAWDRHHTTKFMRQKRGVPDFDASEPEFLIGVLDRHQDWCVIIALIGGGQEINAGEAGLKEWFLALDSHFPHWKIHHSDQMTSDEYAGDIDFSTLVANLDSHPSEDLHLGVSVRSFRAERLSEFVHHLIANDSESARACYKAIQKKYPIYLTRDITKARDWLRERSQGTTLCGITASSGARRLKPHGIDVKAKIEPDVWFLNGPQDVRACQYLEQVATEFDIQGLELDWSCVCWDADLRRDSEKWDYRQFSGTEWKGNHIPINQQYLLNAYRVLLTRARQGMVIYVPEGDAQDRTRLPEFYDPIAQYLHSTGIPSLT